MLWGALGGLGTVQRVAAAGRVHTSGRPALRYGVARLLRLVAQCLFIKNLIVLYNIIKYSNETKMKRQLMLRVVLHHDIFPAVRGVSIGRNHSGTKACVGVHALHGQSPGAIPACKQCSAFPTSVQGVVCTAGAHMLGAGVV